MGLDKKVLFSTQGMNYIDTIKRDKKAVAVEFEAILLKEVLKEAFRPMLEGKTFDTKLYYDIFLENISRKLAEAGGMGIAKFILDNVRDGKT